ncbi:MAG: SDR family oxidoreductase [Gemmatimonadetes bacterium]|nr:SDR family oxidoreductase [Gemmatimonadota bacterium]NNL30826.1 SDR family oxidoreductase [Gemmatimonadota bacterium]
MKFDFRGRTVLVTGAAHGFGRAIAGAFGVRDADVFVCDVVEDELAETVAIVGDRCVGTAVDVTDREAVRRWVDDAHRRTGRIDVLVNNAGGVLGQVGQPLEQVSPAEWQSVVAVNQTAAFWTAQAAAPVMKKARSGRIINISSGAGLGVSKTGIQAYASAKAGQIGLTRQLAHELGPYGITVNNIAPGFVLSNPTTERQWESYGPDGQDRLLEGIALQRLGTPADIAHAVLFLASEHAGWISGVVLPVDGGK